KRPWNGARRKAISNQEASIRSTARPSVKRGAEVFDALIGMTMSVLGELERGALGAEDRGVLRFITAGSVDDGKSTLIGRLLHDSRQVLEDQLASVTRASARKGVEYLDLSLLSDGLEAEREQGITIDVAYRYFATAKRK